MTRLLLILLFLLPSLSYAEVPAQLLKDFSPISGYVVMPMGEDQFLIDLDAEDDVHLGDIFSIIQTGKSIKHPVTGEIIGTLDSDSAFLQVTQLKSGYSYAKKISGALEVKKGDKIDRYKSVTATFTETANIDPQFQTELQRQLPQLSWIPLQDKVNALLSFQRRNNTLIVSSSNFNNIYNYQLSDSSITISPSQGIQDPPREPTIPHANNKPSNSSIIINTNNSNEIWHGPDHKDEVIGLTIDDFNQDGSIETALLLSKKLVISSYKNRQRTILAEMSFKNLSLLGINSFDLDQNGKPEIFINALRNGSPATLVFEYSSKGLESKSDSLPFFVMRFQTAESRPLLLGQKRRDKELPVSGKPFKVVYSAGKYQAGEDFNLPASASIFGTTQFSDENNRVHFLYLSSSDYLKISSDDGEQLFESAEYFGGSENRIMLAPVAKDDLPLSYYLPQRILATQGEFLVAQNDGSRLTNNLRLFTTSRVISLKWDGLALIENWRTSDQQGQTADIALADIDNDGQTELVMAVKFSHKVLFSRPRSALVVYEIK